MEPRTLYLIKRIETEAANEMSRALSAHEITPLQYAVMSFVDTDGEHFSSAQLSRRFTMTPQSMNEIVTILERKDMIEKSSDPNHKRVLRLNLTEKGKAILLDSNTVLDTVEETLFKGLKEKELLAFRATIAKILENIRGK
jgi:DNA-binding MarR family transcriptional regulator